MNEDEPTGGDDLFDETWQEPQVEGEAEPSSADLEAPVAAPNRYEKMTAAEIEEEIAKAKALPAAQEWDAHPGEELDDEEFSQLIEAAKTDAEVPEDYLQSAEARAVLDYMREQRRAWEANLSPEERALMVRDGVTLDQILASREADQAEEIDWDQVSDEQLLEVIAATKEGRPVEVPSKGLADDIFIRNLRRLQNRWGDA